jgi:hypothetical protein
MLFDIHLAMQNADNLNAFLSGVTVKNNMLADPVLEITLPDIVACPA